MPHETDLIAIIAMGLVVAFVGGFVATKLRLPPLVGYLLAGVAVGPFTPGFVGDEALARPAGRDRRHPADVRRRAAFLDQRPDGGPQRSPSRVPWGRSRSARRSAAVVALVWGWSFGAGLVFGLALSVASTVVLLRALEERNPLDSTNGQIAVGWLIVEDLAMVLALVLLPALARHPGRRHAGPRRACRWRRACGWTLLLTLGKVALFLVLVLVVGRAGRAVAAGAGRAHRLARAVHAGRAGDRAWASPTARPCCSASRSRSVRSSPAWC